ncbi:hypothetical protein ABPG74_022575 [Tetrahymena malaccensis]
MEFNSQFFMQNKPYMANANEVQLFKEDLTLEQLDNHAYITDENINQFLNEIHNYAHINTLIVCQDFFYQKIEEWSDFQDQIAQLFAHLPCFDNLTDMYIKLDIYSPNPNQEFRKINLDDIKTQGCPMINSSLMLNDQMNTSYTNILQLLSAIQKSNPYLNNKLNLHLVMCISQDQNTKHFIDSISMISNLKSLEIKYYCQNYAQENINDNQISNNRLLFLNLTRQISKCQSLKSIKLIIPNLNQVQPIQTQENNNSNSYNQEVMQLTSALSMCKNLQKVSLHLPIQFFFQDYLKQKNSSEKNIHSNLKSLSNLKKIKVFEFHLIKFKNTPNMRRKTQQINDLSSYLKKQIVQNLTHLVLYQP